MLSGNRWPSAPACSQVSPGVPDAVGCGSASRDRCSSSAHEIEDMALHDEYRHSETLRWKLSFLLFSLCSIYVIVWKRFPHYWPFVRAVNVGFLSQRLRDAELWYCICCQPEQILKKHSSGRWLETSKHSCDPTALWFHGPCNFYGSQICLLTWWLIRAWIEIDKTDRESHDVDTLG